MTNTYAQKLAAAVIKAAAEAADAVQYEFGSDSTASQAEDRIRSLDIDAIIASVQQVEAATRTSDQVMSDEAKRLWMEIGKAVDRACGELPVGYDLHLELERDAGTIRLYIPPVSDDDAGECLDEFRGDTFGSQINNAIDAAIAAKSKEGGAA